MDKKIAYRVSIVSIIINVILSVMKFIAGIIGKSNAMISDSIHSLSDVLSTIIVIIGIKFASKEADDDHEYGHERIECIASSILASLLILTGLLLGYKNIMNIKNNTIILPNKIALIAAFISIITKEAMYHYTIINAKKINSTALKADAWHHRSDALSSIGSLIGIAGAMLGYAKLDFIASIAICLCIIKVGIDIYIDACDGMIDRACDKQFENSISQIAQKVNGVECIDLLKTRKFGNKIYVDLEIGADKNLTLEKSHQIAENVHDEIEKSFIDVKHCMVHVNPKTVVKKKNKYK